MVVLFFLYQGNYSGKITNSSPILELVWAIVPKGSSNTEYDLEMIGETFQGLIPSIILMISISLLKKIISNGKFIKHI